MNFEMIDSRYLKILIFSVITLGFTDPLIADENSNFQLLTQSAGAILHVEFDRLDHLMEMTKSTEPLFQLVDKGSGRTFGYFESDVKILRSYGKNDEVETFKRMKILIPACKISNRWVLFNPNLRSKDGIILIDGMELGFKHYICLKMFVEFNSSIDARLDRFRR